MTIEAKVIAHSRAHWADYKGDYDGFFDRAPEIITFQLRYPRFIHAEFMTHRKFSRNASSSRAIPVHKMIANLRADTAMPIHWGKNQPGMQAFEEHDALIYGVCGELDMVDNRVEGVTKEAAWLQARDRAIEVAEAFNAAKYHKQIVNRILEPFMHIDVIVTATNYDNFFWLRRHKDAQPEIKVLADKMWEALQASTPRVLAPGEWHMPYVREHEMAMYDLDTLLKVSTARCARVSYLTHDGENPDLESDVGLYERLVGSAPLHASPPEHQAKADEASWGETGPAWDNEHLSGNFDPGWVQHRKLLDGEHCDHYVPEAA
ncbi:hypothetical protein [Phaeobacter phage MD18]|nr:hypothetical protein [Phaeobacter phage MD18]